MATVGVKGLTYRRNSFTSYKPSILVFYEPNRSY